MKAERGRLAVSEYSVFCTVHEIRKAAAGILGEQHFAAAHTAKEVVL